jgi:photosystem II stability/assembly factor-like uncharacterized protein
MSRTQSSSTAGSPGTEPLAHPRSRATTRGPLLALLIIPSVVVWQVLHYRMNTNAPTTAGRPLSNPQTHLHSVALGGRPHVLLLGTHFGLFTSYDGGQSWPQAQGILSDQMILSIAVSPSDYRTLALLGRPYAGPNNAAALYFSTDEGSEWHLGHAPTGISHSAYLFSIQAGTAAAGQFYAFYEYGGWYETRDLGAHWYPITSGILSRMQTPSLLTDPSNPNHLLLGGDQGLYETNSDGRSWSRVDAVSGNVLGLVASLTTPRLVYCTTDQGIYRWRAGSTSFAHFAHLPTMSEPQLLVTDASGADLYALAGQELWHSGDGGQNWQRRWRFDRGDLVSLLLDPRQPQDLYAGFFSPGQLLMSSDGGRSWQTLTR